MRRQGGSRSSRCWALFTGEAGPALHWSGKALVGPGQRRMDWKEQGRKEACSTGTGSLSCIEGALQGGTESVACGGSSREMPGWGSHEDGV